MNLARGFLATLFLVFSFFPFSAFAAIYSQSIANTKDTATVRGYSVGTCGASSVTGVTSIQPLGSGFTGVPGDLFLSLSEDSGFSIDDSTRWLRACIFETDSDATSSVTGNYIEYHYKLQSNSPQRILTASSTSYGGSWNSVSLLNPNKYYFLSFYSNSTNIGRIWGNASSLNGYICYPLNSSCSGSPYYIFNTSATSSLPSYVTRISGVTPGVDSISASSTSFTFGAVGNIADQDYRSGITVYIRYLQKTGMGLRGNSIYPEGGNKTWNISVPGSFSLSTTTSVFQTGIYQAYVAIYRPKFSIFGITIPFFSDTLADLTWDFTVATSSASITDGERAEAALLLSSTGFSSSASSTVDDTRCHASLDFSITDCLSLLFVPTGNDVLNDFNLFHDTFLVKAPIGYVTRFVSIISGSVAGVEPPPLIDYSFGSSSPAILQSITANDPIIFQPFDHLTELNSVRSDQGDNKSVWDVFDPFVTLIVSFAVLSVIIGDLIGMEFTFGGSDVDEDTIKLPRMYDSESGKDVSKQFYG
jgi:hypothetical protein